MLWTKCNVSVSVYLFTELVLNFFQGRKNTIEKKVLGENNINHNYLYFKHHYICYTYIEGFDKCILWKGEDKGEVSQNKDGKESSRVVLF